MHDHSMGSSQMHPTPKIHFIVAAVTIFAIIADLCFGFLGIGQEPLGYISNAKLADIPLILVIILCGVPICAKIIYGLIRLELGADIVAALAIGSAAFIGEYMAASLVILMLSGGQAIEAYAAKRASSVLLALSKRIPAIAHRRNGKYIEEVTISDVKIGDKIVIYPHEASVVDGVVIEGHGWMDESYLTGEPYIIPKSPGSSVISGSLNGESMIVIEAEKLPKDSRYAKIIGVMQEAEEKKIRIRRIGDKIGGALAPIAIGIASIAWFLSSDIERFVSVLMVATPCPLFVAIPVAVISAISLCAKRGIVIRDPAILENLPRCKTAIFDKTGTLTYGKPDLTDVVTLNGFEKHDVLQLAASIERYSKHPLSQPILLAAEEAKLALIEPTNVSEKPGAGLSGVVLGKNVRITHRKKITEESPEIASQIPQNSYGLECVILIDNSIAGVLTFRDKPRPDGKSFVAHLGPSHQFEKVMLVSGDRESEVKYLADLLGIKETKSSQTPEQKLEIVRHENKLAPTLFMGDGINDAPALTSATSGIAFGSDNAITSEAAGAVIMDSTLMKVDELIHISIDMRKIVLQSAIGGMGLSLICMAFAAFGFITPVAGALIEHGIDFLAISNALRLSFKTKIEADIGDKNAL